jgi:hypothetical protein
MKNMKITTSPPGGAFQKGGSNKMHGWSGTGTQEPGQSAQQGTGSKRGIAPKAGPSDVMGYRDHAKKGREMSATASANQFGAGPQEPGQSASSGARQDGFAKGGTTPMHGNTGSTVAVPGQSSK